MACAALSLAWVPIPATASETQTYTYDMHGHHVAVQYTGTVNNNQAHSTCFDLAGNRTKYKSDSGGTVATCTSSPSVPAYGPPTFAVGDAYGSEGVPIGVIVTKTGATSGSFSVNYATANGTALAGSDYVASSGTLTFASNESSKTITITLYGSGPNSIEPQEYFYINLSSPSGGATITDSQAVVYIDDTSEGGGCSTC